MGIDYVQLKSDVSDILKDLGVSQLGVVTHSAGTTSKGYITISQTDITVTDDAHVSRVVGTQLIGFIEDLKNTPCPGDTITASNVTYKIREVAAYNPSGKQNVAYKLTLDA
jgi:hypothetical protein